MQAMMVFVFLTAVFLISCSREREAKQVSHHEMGGHGMTGDWKFALPRGDPVEGRKVSIEVECYKCHQVNGETFPAVGQEQRRIGPELSQMAGMHPAEFFAESIINPNAVVDPKGKELGYIGDDARSKMPDYGNVLTIRQVVDLAAYVQSLKGKISHEQMGH